MGTTAPNIEQGKENIYEGSFTKFWDYYVNVVFNLLRFKSMTRIVLAIIFFFLNFAKVGIKNNCMSSLKLCNYRKLQASKYY